MESKDLRIVTNEVELLDKFPNPFYEEIVSSLELAPGDDVKLHVKCAEPLRVVVLRPRRFVPPVIDLLPND